MHKVAIQVQHPTTRCTRKKNIARGSGCYLKPKACLRLWQQAARLSRWTSVYLLTKIKKIGLSDYLSIYTNKQSNNHSDYIYLTTKAIYDLTCKSCWPKKVSFSIPLHKAKVAYLDNIHAYICSIVTTCFPFTPFFYFFTIFLFVYLFSARNNSHDF